MSDNQDFRLTEAELEGIRKIDATTNHCDKCHRRVAIDRYGISGTMCRVLRKMAEQTERQRKANDPKGRAVDTQAIGLKNSEPNQLSKMRFLGLIAKVRDDKGVHVPRNWLITRRGYAFLAGDPVPAKVEVYDNAVLGTFGGVTTIKEREAVNSHALDEVDSEGISEAQSTVLEAAKGAGVSKLVYEAEYRRKGYGKLKEGQRYMLTVEKLQIGKPVKLTVDMAGENVEMQYSNVAAFAHDWKKVTT